MATEQQIREANARVTLPPPRELTKEEKRANWWYYHKWHVIIGAVLFVSLLDILRNAFGIGKVKPDYSIAYVGSVQLNDDAVKALEAEFAALSPDMNGDGKVSVELLQYIAADTGDSDTLYYAQAQQVQIVGDVTDNISSFFILEDPAGFQQMTQALCNLDGSLPAEGDLKADGKYLNWKDCPVLASLGRSALAGIDTPVDLSGMAFARRGYWGDAPENADSCSALWESLITGAVLPE